MSDNFYITTPIYYVNAQPHLGHVYTTVIADVLTRYHKIIGQKVFFLTGTDEHGDKIVETATKLGTTPDKLANENSDRFRALWPEMSIEINRFIRTTDPDHIRTVKKILKDVYDKGDIYFGEYAGKYCVGCERFFSESELVDGKCPIHETEPELRQEQNYFFRMEKYRPWLIDYINSNPDFIRPERYKNEVIGMLREPLDDLCISRPKSRLTWGIELPFDKDYVCYVWFDALINYLTGIDYPEGDNFKEFWGVCQHMIAKDILKPHAIYWSTMLKAMGVEPYKHLNVHGYWNIDQSKMSKSLGNVVDPLDMKEKYGLDAFRYFLVRDMVFGLDSNFSEQAMVERYNSDLANDLGNLVSRSTKMVAKYYDGILPEPESPLQEEDKKLQNLALDSTAGFLAKMEKIELHNAMIAVWSLIAGMNRYIDHSAPWKLVKSDRARLSTVIYTIMEAMRYVAVMIQPVMTQTSSRILEILGHTDNISFDTLETFGALKPGSRILVDKALFPRVEKIQLEQSIETEEASNLIDISEFAKTEIKAGKVVEADRVKGSDKLLLLKVDVGKVIQIVAGMGKDYTPQDIVGKYIAVVTNLKPAKLMGIESQGMLLAAKTTSGGLTLLSFDSEPTVGSKVS